MNLDSFEHVWQTVRDKHWDPRLGGLDWQAVHDELKPKIDEAANMDQAREVMGSMLARLKQTHFGIVPAQVYEELDSPGARDGTCGLEARVIEDQALVTSVQAGSPAAAQGVRPGWQIVRVDGKEVAPTIRKIQEQFAGSTLRDLLSSRSVTSRLNGAAGSPVRIDFVDGDGHPVSVELKRASPRGTMAKLGYLPPMYFWVESRKVRPDIGYVRFDLFFEPEALAKAFAGMVDACRECSGFIIDVRGNPGGIGGLATGVAGWFVPQTGLRLGAMQLRQTNLKFVIFPRPEPFSGPLAILVDGCSASTSEIFAGGLQDLKRARIFGTRTAGAALPSQFERLPNGDGFQYAIANYISEGGKPLEGLGVTPDEEVKLTRRQLLDGHDPVLEAAEAWIQKQKQ